MQHEMAHDRIKGEELKDVDFDGHISQSAPPNCNIGVALTPPGDSPVVAKAVQVGDGHVIHKHVPLQDGCHLLVCQDKGHVSIAQLMHAKVAVQKGQEVVACVGVKAIGQGGGRGGGWAP